MTALGAEGRRFESCLPDHFSGTCECSALEQGGNEGNTPSAFGIESHGIVPEGCAEEWRPCPIFGDRYEVSNLGRVRSSKGVKSPYRDKDGYPAVNLHRNGVRRARNVHRLVAEAFVAGRNEIQDEVAHLDGNRGNARADNLKWCSKIENHSHKLAHGTHMAGERHPHARLSVDAVRDIRASDATLSALGAKYGVTAYAIRDVRRGRNWRSVPQEDAPNPIPSPKDHLHDE